MYTERVVRPSKLECLFSAMETLLLHAGGRFIFIIHCHFLLISYSIFKNLELVCEGFNTHDGPGNDCKLLQKGIQKPCCSTNHCKKSQLCTTSTYRPTRGKKNSCLQHPALVMNNEKLGAAPLKACGRGR